jgi:DNA replication protein DnaC
VNLAHVEVMMDSLAEMLNKFKVRFDSLPEDVRYIPDDGICPNCDAIKRDHPGVERVLIARGMMDYDEEAHRYRPNTPILRCKCEEEKTQAAYQMEQSANLPLSVRGALPRSFVAGTLANFTERDGTEEAYGMCQDYVNENTAPILVLRGPRGTGKTHLMEAVGRELIARDMTVRYERVPALLSRIRSSYDRAYPEVAEDDMRRCHLAQLLMLDDLGSEKSSEWVQEKIFELIDERYGTGRLLIVSTNDSYASLSNNLGERIASRLFDENSGKVVQVIMTCSDYRRE